MKKLNTFSVLVACIAFVLVPCNVKQAAAQTQAKEKKQIVRGEQAPPANPGQNNFGGPIPAPGAGGQMPAFRPPRPEPQIQTVSIDDISMSDPF
ncbi:MAG: hypothetical protein JXR67_05295, partial [Bacteroidales bacterium]|nr:hypothetical protein [Bacteroidales bacterium]